jgi:hypothetical protein
LEDSPQGFFCFVACRPIPSSTLIELLVVIAIIAVF